MAYLGLDIGTSNAKAGVFSLAGDCLSLHNRAYSIRTPGPGEMELDAREVWRACEEVIAACAAEVAEPIAALSVSSQGEAVFPVSLGGEPLASALVTFDGRASGQARRLKAMLEDEARTSLLRPVHSMFSAAKLLWLKGNAPNAGVYKYMCFSDYAAFMLSGEAAVDYGMASRMMLFDVRLKRWNQKALDAVGLDESLLSLPVQGGTVLGDVRPEVARRLGLPPGMKVVAGGHDQQLCAYAVGAVGSGVVMDTLGTTESILSVADQPRYDEHLAHSCIPCDAFIRPGLYAYLGFLSTSGQAVDWLRKGLLDGRWSYEELSACGREPTGILVLPHFAGSGTPWLDERDKGLIYGLTCATRRQDLFKAMMEGTAFEARRNVELMRGCGLTIGEIRVTGGGAKSDLWLQIKANTYGMPLTVLRSKESGALGAAMLAARGLQDIGSEMPWVQVERVVEPEGDGVGRYQEQFERYCVLCAALEGFKHGGGL